METNRAARQAKFRNMDAIYFLRIELACDRLPQAMLLLIEQPVLHSLGDRKA
jgi:hypothetical protein